LWKGKPVLGKFKKRVGDLFLLFCFSARWFFAISSENSDTDDSAVFLKKSVE